MFLLLFPNSALSTAKALLLGRASGENLLISHHCYLC